MQMKTFHEESTNLEPVVYAWLRVRAKITSHLKRPSIPLSGVAKIRNMPDIT